ncbi:ankyrin repeat-containing domain protein [Aspergillus oleicola]
MPIPFIPTDILLNIADHFQSLNNFPALTRANCRFRDVFDPLLYKRCTRLVASIAIAWAARHGKIDVIRKFLYYGAVLRTTSESAEVFRGQIRIVYGKQNSYDFRNYPWPHPLCLAVEGGHLDIMRFLLDYGCDLDMKSPEWHSLLCIAVMHQHRDIVAYLLAQGARQDDPKLPYSNSAIQVAAFHGREDIVIFLLHSAITDASLGLTVDQIRDAFATALRHNHRRVIRILLDELDDLNFCFPEHHYRGRWWSPLFWAVEWEDLDLVELFLASGKANTRFWTMQGNGSALHRAVLKNNEGVARLLVGYALPVERTQALAFSTEFPDGRMAQMLLENGTDSDFKSNGINPLHMHPLDEGITGEVVPPLICAIRFKNTNLVRLLVDRGANVNEAYIAIYSGSMSSGCPLLLARQLKDRKTVDFLRELRADENKEKMRLFPEYFHVVITRKVPHAEERLYGRRSW